MERTFSQVLIEFLDQRDLINSNYYDNRQIGSRLEATKQLNELGAELDEIINTLSDDITDVARLYIMETRSDNS